MYQPNSTLQLQFRARNMTLMKHFRVFGGPSFFRSPDPSGCPPEPASFFALGGFRVVSFEGTERMNCPPGKVCYLAPGKRRQTPPNPSTLSHLTSSWSRGARTTEIPPPPVIPRWCSPQTSCGPGGAGCTERLEGLGGSWQLMAKANPDASCMVYLPLYADQLWWLEGSMGIYGTHGASGKAQ